MQSMAWCVHGLTGEELATRNLGPWLYQDDSAGGRCPVELCIAATCLLTPRG